jgi:hypothetical protein
MSCVIRVEVVRPNVDLVLESTDISNTLETFE